MPKSITDPTYVGSKAYVNYIKVLKNMKFWIARDKDSSLWMYDDEPILRSENSFGVKPNQNGKTKPAKPLHDWYFSEITFKNSPQMVEVKFTKKE